MTPEEFKQRAYEIAKESDVIQTHHNYFLLHAGRLFKTHQWFGTFDMDLGDTLEIGPLYSYTPFFLLEQVKSYQVLEGDEPGVYPLLPLYEKYGIKYKITDLGLIFGNPLWKERRLPFDDNSFDSIFCWETIEHFNFNPVPFIRELNRIAKKGGKLLLTVPNRASAESFFNLITGRGQIEHIDEFFKYADYEVKTGHTFFGFHWHEYTKRELIHLLTGCGFFIEKVGCITEFQEKPDLSFLRKAIRSVLKITGIILPSFGNHICVIAVKK